MRQYRHFFVLLGLVAGLSIISAVEAAASVRNGLSLGFGVGVMSATNEDLYMGIGTDLYPEGQLAYDIGPVKLGLHVGYIWRKKETSSYSSRTGYRYSEKTVAFVPVELDLCFMPLRFVGHGRMAFQPYLGIGVGSMGASGDNTEDVSIAPVIRTGITFYTGDWNIIGIDLAHHIAKGENNDSNYSYTTLMLEYRFRIPFVKKHQHEEASNMQKTVETAHPTDTNSHELEKMRLQLEIEKIKLEQDRLKESGSK